MIIDEQKIINLGDIFICVVDSCPFYFCENLNPYSNPKECFVYLKRGDFLISIKEYISSTSNVRMLMFYNLTQNMFQYSGKLFLFPMYDDKTKYLEKLI